MHSIRQRNTDHWSLIAIIGSDCLKLFWITLLLYFNHFHCYSCQNVLRPWCENFNVVPVSYGYQNIRCRKLFNILNLTSLTRSSKISIKSSSADSRFYCFGCSIAVKAPKWQNHLASLLFLRSLHWSKQINDDTVDSDGHESLTPHVGYGHNQMMF